MPEDVIEALRDFAALLTGKRIATRAQACP
jgi:hypothetical protein